MKTLRKNSDVTRSLSTKPADSKLNPSPFLPNFPHNSHQNWSTNITYHTFLNNNKTNMTIKQAVTTGRKVEIRMMRVCIKDFILQLHLSPVQMLTIWLKCKIFLFQLTISAWFLYSFFPHFPIPLSISQIIFVSFAILQKLHNLI